MVGSASTARLQMPGQLGSSPVRENMQLPQRTCWLTVKLYGARFVRQTGRAGVLARCRQPVCTYERSRGRSTHAPPAAREHRVLQKTQHLG